MRPQTAFVPSENAEPEGTSPERPENVASSSTSSVVVPMRESRRAGSFEYTSSRFQVQLPVFWDCYCVPKAQLKGSTM